MNISYRKCFASGKIQSKSLVEFLTEELNNDLTSSSDVDLVVASVENCLDNTNYVVAKLLDFLVEKGIMTPEYLIDKFLTDGRCIFDIELTREVNDNAKQL